MDSLKAKKIETKKNKQEGTTGDAEGSTVSQAALSADAAEKRLAESSNPSSSSATEKPKDALIRFDWISSLEFETPGSES